MSANLQQILLAACREYAEAHAEWVEGRTEDPVCQEAAHRTIITLGEARRKAEPTTLAELEAAGWKPSKVTDFEWVDLQVGPFEVTVFRSGHVSVRTYDFIREADACRLAARLAEVLRSFTPTGG